MLLQNGNVDITLKEEYKPLTMTGVWEGVTSYDMISNKSEPHV